MSAAVSKRKIRKASTKTKVATCPACGTGYDPAQHVLLTCKSCHSKGSTACCHTSVLSRKCDVCADEYPFALRLDELDPIQRDKVLRSGL